MNPISDLESGTPIIHFPRPRCGLRPASLQHSHYKVSATMSGNERNPTGAKMLRDAGALAILICVLSATAYQAGENLIA